jgi:hypothetical protein
VAVGVADDETLPIELRVGVLDRPGCGVIQERHAAARLARASSTSQFFSTRQLSPAAFSVRHIPVAARGNRSPPDRDRCGARLVRARQAGWGTWLGDFERPPRHRPRCVRRPPQPRNLHRRKLPQRFPYPQAYGSETAATPPNGHARQERATEAYRPEAPLRQSALLRVPFPRSCRLRQERAGEADFQPEAPLRHSALLRVIWQLRPRYRFVLTRRSD